MLPEEVEITEQISSAVQQFTGKKTFTKIAVLVDENTEKHCLPLIRDSIPEDSPVIRIKSGEEHKNLATSHQIWSELTHHKLDRKGLLINLGGGVIGDMGGFCAATYKRGISFVNIPTTLLAQVDASIGGKLGVDFEGFKNHIGLFRKPDKVLIDTLFFNTLPERELRSGFAEIIKHCLIADKNQWKKIVQKGLDDQNWKQMVRHSAELKNQIVEKDPWESGLRKILNFGHTIGHSIETFFLTTMPHRLLHGEAIAVGMICESYISEKTSGLSGKEVMEIENYILKIFNKTELDPSSFQKIVDYCMQDKKNEKGQMNFSLLTEIGNAAIDVTVEKEDILKALHRYNQL